MYEVLSPLRSFSFLFLDTFAVTNSVNSGNGRLEVVCHLLSSCEHASITNKSDSTVFEFSDNFQRCVVVREGGNRRGTFAEEDHDFCFVSVELEPFETCIVIEFFELQIFSHVWSESNVISIITVRDFNWIQGSGSTSLYSQESVYVIVKREFRRGLRGQPCFKPLLGATSSEILSPLMRRFRHPVYMVWMISLKYCGVLIFCVSEVSLLEYCRKQQGVSEKQWTPFFSFLQWGWLVFLVGQKPICQIESLVFDVQQEPSPSASPWPRLQKSIDTTIDSQQTIMFGGRSWTFFV